MFAYDAHHMVRHTDRNNLSFYYEYEGARAARRVVFMGSGTMVADGDPFA